MVSTAPNNGQEEVTLRIRINTRTLNTATTSMALAIRSAHGEERSGIKAISPEILRKRLSEKTSVLPSRTTLGSITTISNSMKK